MNLPNSVIKGLIFIGGAAIGSAVTAILFAKSYSEKIAEIRQSYEDEIAEINKRIFEKDIPQDGEKADNTTDEEDPMKFKRPKADIVDYHGKFDASQSITPVIGAPTYNDIVQSVSYAGSEDEGGPVLITQEIFDTNPHNFTKSYLRYYQQDDYLCDVNDEEEPIVDIDYWVGYDNLKIFKDTDEEYIWIAHFDNHTMAEIEVVRNGPCPINDIFDPE